MEAAEIDQHLTELEERLEKLRVLYDQYFSGIERFEPARKREDVERRIKTLRREHIRNTGQRFKFQQVLQRYTTFAQYWTRILREIEKGTYKRDLARAAKRFGGATSGKKKVTQQELEQAAQAAASDEPEELDSSWIEEAEEIEEADEDTSPFRRSELDLRPAAAQPSAPQVAPPPAAISSSVAPLSTPRPLPGAPAVVPAPAASRPLMPVPPAPRAPAPSAPMMPQPPLPRAPAPSAPAVEPPAPAAAQAPAPATTIKRPAPAPTRLDLDDDDLLGGGQPSPRAQPRPAVTPAAAATTPRPAPVVPAPRPPASSQPAVAVPSQPRPSVAAPSAPQPSAPQPRPSTPQPAPPREVEIPAAAAQLPRAQPRPAPRDEELDERRIRDIYNRYVEARRKCNESTAAITLDGLSRSLRDSVPKLQQKHGGRVVDFEVVVKDGRTVLKPVVKA